MTTYMKKRGLKEIEHGKRGRYVQGCRCELCTKANRDYVRARYLAKCRGKADPLVPAWRARRKLEKLAKAGIGTHTIADVTGVSRTIILNLKTGRKKKLRKSTLDKLNAMTTQPWADGQLVDAAETWELLDDLISCGWSKSELARQLGSKAKTPALQISRDQVTAKNAQKVKNLYEKLKWESPPPRRTRWTKEPKPQ